jgi:hypothetical protein
MQEAQCASVVIYGSMMQEHDALQIVLLQSGKRTSISRLTSV